MFQIWFQKSNSRLFQRSFLIISHFLTDLLEYAYVNLLMVHFFNRNALVFKCSEADWLSVSILPDLMLLVVGVRKRAVYKECLVLGMKCIVHELDPTKMGIFGSGGKTKHNIDF